MNGSSSNPNCTSVLFDESPPELTGLDGNMWASELITIRADNFARINFTFSEGSGYTGMGRVEVVMFNCPQWGIGAEAITLGAGNREINMLNPNVSSCDSLVKVCMQYFVCNNPPLSMVLRLGSNKWVHLAEVTFYNGNYSTTCPPEAILDSPTTPPSATTTLASTDDISSSPSSM